MTAKTEVKIGQLRRVITPLFRAFKKSELGGLVVDHHKSSLLIVIEERTDDFSMWCILTYKGLRLSFPNDIYEKTENIV